MIKNIGSIQFLSSGQELLCFGVSPRGSRNTTLHWELEAGLKVAQTDHLVALS